MILGWLALACSGPSVELRVPEGPLAGEVKLEAEGNFDQLILLVDGELLAGGEGPALSARWDTRDVLDGEHLVRAVGYGGAAHEGEGVEAEAWVEVDQVAGDSEDPTINFDQPGEGQEIFGSDVPIALTVSDDVGAAEVALYANDSFLAWLKPEGPWELAWEGVRSGQHTLRAEVWDASGRSASDTVTFEVFVEEDLTCTFTQPAAGSSVSGVTELKVATGSEAGIAAVEFYADGVLLGRDQTSPTWSLDWDSSSWAGQTVDLSTRVLAGDGALCEDQVEGVRVLESDDEGFTVRITAPASSPYTPSAGELESQLLTVRAAIGGGAGVDAAELWLEGSMVERRSAEPWEWRWDFAALSPGTSANLRVVGYQTGGGQAEDTVLIQIPAEESKDGDSGDPTDSGLAEDSDPG